MVKNLSIFLLLIALSLMSTGYAEQRSSITQYGITWTFNGQYECGQFVTGDWWVVGPVTINSVSPMQTDGRNGSLLNPMPFRQGYDNRSLASYVYSTEDRVSFPVTLQANSSLVSSVSKPENTTVFKDVGSLYSQAVLTVVSAPVASGTFRPSYCGTYKKYFTTNQVNMGLLPSIPAPPSTPSASEVLHYTERPRIDHVCSWLLQHVCAQDNWYNGPNAHNCYAQFYSQIISVAGLYAMLNVPDREEVVRDLIQIGIDNFGVLKAGGGWHSDGGHGSGRKFPVVMAAILLNDPDMLQVGSNYGDRQFGDDAQTYYGVNGKALWGQDDPNDNGCYFLSGCTQSGCRKDERDPAHLQDGCPDYRTYNTSPTWVGQMLATLMIPNAKAVWNHNAYFDYVDRWMTGDVERGGWAGSAFIAEMWQLYRHNLPTGGPIVDVTAVSISPASLTLEEGLSGLLTATVMPSNASYKTVSWSSNNTSVATVDAYGLVTAIAPGSATITATAQGGFTDNCAVTVTSIGTNVALLRPITVSSYDIPSGKPGTGLVDGDVSDEARWTASGFPQWAEIDLGADYEITRIDLFPYLNRAYQYTIEGKTQSGTYTTIVNRSNNSEAADNLSDDVSTTARYIKINISGIYGSTTNWLSLAELKVYSNDEITPVSVTGVSVSPTSLSLVEGQSSDLTETVSPSNASNKVVTWSSNNTAIATVNSIGLVTAVSEGSANITVTTDDGSYTAVCAVTVTEAPDPVSVDSVTVSPTSLNLNNGQSFDLAETVFPSNATNKAVTWSSSNATIATVNSTGLVTAISAGSTNITVTTTDGSFTAICSVTVSAVIPSGDEYYCDPVSGSMSNTGSQSSPWSSLADVFATGKTFAAGDVIYLMDGNHGTTTIQGHNSGEVKITAAAGDSPEIDYVIFSNASHWTIDGITFSPNFGPSTISYFVTIPENSSYNTVANCTMYSALSCASWTESDWNSKAWSGFDIDGQHNTARNNTIKNVRWGFRIHYTGEHTIVEYNQIENLMNDGIQTSANYCVFQYNTIKNVYAIDTNHDDFLQCYSLDADWNVGTTTVYGVEIRGNIFISFTDAAQPYKSEVQGIGLFDGMYEDFIIENNVIITDMWHGISLYGGKNCIIVNNTVVKNPINAHSMTPWIYLNDHKNGTPSTGNIVKNNISSVLSLDPQAGDISNNIETTAYSTYYADYLNFDLHLAASSPAIDAGVATVAPSIDIEGNARPQGGGYDIGAYEYPGAIVDETGITLIPTETSVEIGQTTNLTETIIPSNATYKSVTWSSSNTAVATVNSFGTVTGISLGVAVITATTNNLGFSATSAVTVIQPSGDYNLAFNKPVTVTADNPPSIGSLLVDDDTDDESRWSAEGFPQSATIDLGEECILSSIYLYTYQDRAYQYIVEASSDGSNYSLIVDRSSNTSDLQPNIDNISAVGRYVKITVTGAPVYTGTWVSLTELMIIGSPQPSGVNVTGVSVTPTSLSLYPTETADLTEIISPSNATNMGVSWSSSDASVASVNSSGMVTAVSIGSATITATTEDGGFTATCAVTVYSSNIALNKTVTVSDYQDDPGFTFPGSNLVDGDVSDATRWAADVFPQWAEIDLGANYDLNSINVFPYQNRAYQYIIEAKTDGGAYSTIVDRSSNTEGADVLDDPVSGTARYIKITVSGLYSNPSSWTSLAELEVYGVPSAAASVTGVSVSPTSLSLNEGQTFDLTETVSPIDATDKSVTWSSSNSSSATVNASGLVTAVSAGTDTITVTTNDGGFTATCIVTIVDPTIYVTGVSLSSSTLSLDEGQTSDLNATISPANATYPGVIWSSGNTDVATVNAEGLVTAISAGTDTITVTTNDGGFTAICVVTVTDPTVYVTGVSLSSSTLSIEEDQTSDLDETISPANATDLSVIWTSNNPSVATVNSSGLVTAVAAGNAIVTVTTVDGGYTATCAITVTATNPFAANTIGYWAMDEINTGITPDGSGNSNDGVVTGATLVSGYSDNALNFDGANDEVSIGNIDVFPSNGNDGLTLAAWINPDTWVASYYDDRIISKSTGTAEQDHYWMMGPVKSGSLAVLRFRLKTGTTTTTLIASEAGEIPLNQWSHVAATYDGSNMKIYLNGTLVGSLAKTGTVATSSSVEATIGINPDGARPFDGQIDEVYVLNKGLTATEINSLISGAKSKNIRNKTQNLSSAPILILHPNPCTEGSLTVDIYGINSEKDILIQIVDISGRIVYSDEIISKSSSINSLKINTGNMNQGVYFFKMTNGENIIKEKLIIHK